MGLLYDRNFDGGQGKIEDTDIPLDGSQMHVSQYDASTNTRTSWDTNGSIDGTVGDPHWTNQNVGKRHPDRH